MHTLALTRAFPGPKTLPRNELTLRAPSSPSFPYCRLDLAPTPPAPFSRGRLLRRPPPAPLTAPPLAFPTPLLLHLRWSPPPFAFLASSPSEPPLGRPPSLCSGHHPSASRASSSRRADRRLPVPAVTTSAPCAAVVLHRPAFSRPLLVGRPPSPALSLPRPTPHLGNVVLCDDRTTLPEPRDGCDQSGSCRLPQDLVLASGVGPCGATLPEPCDSRDQSGRPGLLFLNLRMHLESPRSWLASLTILSTGR